MGKGRPDEEVPSSDEGGSHGGLLSSVTGSNLGFSRLCGYCTENRFKEGKGGSRRPGERRCWLGVGWWQAVGIVIEETEEGAHLVESMGSLVLDMVRLGCPLVRQWRS